MLFVERFVDKSVAFEAVCEKKRGKKKKKQRDGKWLDAVRAISLISNVITMFFIVWKTKWILRSLTIKFDYFISIKTWFSLHRLMS